MIFLVAALSLACGMGKRAYGSGTIPNDHPLRQAPKVTETPEEQLLEPEMLGAAALIGRNMKCGQAYDLSVATRRKGLLSRFRAERMLGQTTSAAPSASVAAPSS